MIVGKRMLACFAAGIFLMGALVSCKKTVSEEISSLPESADTSSSQTETEPEKDEPPAEGYVRYLLGDYAFDYPENWYVDGENPVQFSEREVALDNILVTDVGVSGRMTLDILLKEKPEREQEILEQYPNAENIEMVEYSNDYGVEALVISYESFTGGLTFYVKQYITVADEKYGLIFTAACNNNGDAEELFGVLDDMLDSMRLNG